MIQNRYFGRLTIISVAVLTFLSLASSSVFAQRARLCASETLYKIYDTNRFK